MSENQIKIGVGVLIIRGDKALLTKRINSHGQGTYGSVGGHLDFGETPIEAVKRECREELNIEIYDVEFLDCSNLLMYGKHYIDITFIAKTDALDIEVQEPEKIESADWYDLGNLPSPLFPPVALSVEALNKKKSYFEYKD